MRKLTNKAVRAPLLLGAALAAVFAAGPAFADCSDLDARVRAAIEAGARQQFRGLLEEVLAEPSCDGTYRSKLPRVLALAALKSIANEAKASGGKPVLADLEQAAALAEPWQLTVTLADAYYDAREWPNAFRFYEKALDDMSNKQINPSPPPEAVERHAYLRAVQARALAPTYVASRALPGEESGVQRTTFRNFSVVSVPVPVRFEFNSAELTPDGVNFAREILDHAKGQGGKLLRLVGHTDPVGSDEYNLRLSIARAEAVRAFLVSNGYEGAIEVVGKGEADPFQADDPTKYSQDELFAMNRRVEFEVVH